MKFTAKTKTFLLKKIKYTCKRSITESLLMLHAWMERNLVYVENKSLWIFSDNYIHT